MACNASVVLPLDSGPKISTIRPRGMPCPPNAMSSDRQPVGIPSTTRFVPSPNCMIAPLPNCFSIWPSVFFSIFSSCETWVAIHSLSWLEAQNDLHSLIHSYAERWIDLPETNRVLVHKDEILPLEGGNFRFALPPVLVDTVAVKADQINATSCDRWGRCLVRKL